MWPIKQLFQHIKPHNTVGVNGKMLSIVASGQYAVVLYGANKAG